MLGYGGHFFTKSRRYSATFRQLRQARVDYRRAHHVSGEHLEENRVLEVIAELVYAGTGWHTTGDAMLANTAAAMARERRTSADWRSPPPVDTYVSTASLTPNVEGDRPVDTAFCSRRRKRRSGFGIGRSECSTS